VASSPAGGDESGIGDKEPRVDGNHDGAGREASTAAPVNTLSSRTIHLIGCATGGLAMSRPPGSYRSAEKRPERTDTLLGALARRLARCRLGARHLDLISLLLALPQGLSLRLAVVYSSRLPPCWPGGLLPPGLVRASSWLLPKLPFWLTSLTLSELPTGS